MEFNTNNKKNHNQTHDRTLKKRIYKAHTSLFLRDNKKI